MGEDLLNHANQNRREWEEKGQQIATEMLTAVKGNDKTLLVDASHVEHSYAKAQVSFNGSPSSETVASDHWQDEALEIEEITDQIDV